MGRRRYRRRTAIAAGLSGLVSASAGCLGLLGSDSGPDLATVEFTFTYEPGADGAGTVTIEHAGGDDLRAGNLTVRTSDGDRATWSELGSTVEQPDDLVTTGSTARVGADVLNWPSAVRRGELVRVVYTSSERSVTEVGRFVQPTPTPTPSPVSTPTPAPTRSPDPTPTPATDVVWADDFEDGSLADYAVTRADGGDDTAGYEVVTEPSIGERALRHRTESRVLHPAEPVTVSPPAVAVFDLYIDGWSGVDFLLQRNLDADLTYRVDVRNNANGGFVRVKKAGGGHADVESFAEDTAGKDGDPDVIAPRRWERIAVRWTEENVAATALGSDRWVSITDSDERLRGNGFGLIGYHYSGWAAIDNLLVRTGTTETPDRDWDVTATPRPDG